MASANQNRTFNNPSVGLGESTKSVSAGKFATRLSAKSSITPTLQLEKLTLVGEFAKLFALPQGRTTVALVSLRHGALAGTV